MIGSSHQRVVFIAPLMERHNGEDRSHGDCRPIKLECGHTIHSNPTMTWRLGDWQRCRECVS